MQEKKGRQILPWQDLMRIGLGQLKLTPKQFWNTTPRELKCDIEGELNAFIGDGLHNPLSKSNLEKLMKKFPDKSD